MNDIRYSQQNDSSKIGVVTEQGDLGLGFNPISSDEEKVLTESESNKKNTK